MELAHRTLASEDLIPLTGAHGVCGLDMPANTPTTLLYEMDKHYSYTGHLFCGSGARCGPPAEASPPQAFLETRATDSRNGV